MTPDQRLPLQVLNKDLLSEQMKLSRENGIVDLRSSTASLLWALYTVDNKWFGEASLRIPSGSTDILECSQFQSSSRSPKMDSFHLRSADHVLLPTLTLSPSHASLHGILSTTL